MLTLAIGELARQLADSWTSLTGGANGLAGVPPLQLIPGGGPIVIAGHIYWYVLAVTALAYGLLAVVRASAFGQALKGMRDNEDRMRSLGYSVTGLKLAALVVAGGFAGLAGSLWVTQLRFVSPGDVGFTTSAMALLVRRHRRPGQPVGVVRRRRRRHRRAGRARHGDRRAGPAGAGPDVHRRGLPPASRPGGARAVGPAAGSETGAGNGSGAMSDPAPGWTGGDRGPRPDAALRRVVRGRLGVDPGGGRRPARRHRLERRREEHAVRPHRRGAAADQRRGVPGRGRRDPAGRAPPGPAGPGPHVPARQPVRPGERGGQRGAGGAALAGLRLPALARPAAGGGRRRPGGAAAGDGRTDGPGGDSGGQPVARRASPARGCRGAGVAAERAAARRAHRRDGRRRRPAGSWSWWTHCRRR